MARKKKGLPAHWRHLIYYISALIILILVWRFIPAQAIKIAAVWGFFITQLLFNLNGDKKEMIAFFQFANWAYVVLFFFLAIAYSASAVHEPEITIWAILIMFLIMLIGAVVSTSIDLLHSKHWFLALITYLALSASVITLFGLVYAISGAFLGNGILEGQPAPTAWTYMYFSSSTFYSNVVGNFNPQGVSQLISQLELVFSAIIHIFMLGYVIAVLTKDKKIVGQKP